MKWLNFKYFHYYVVGLLLLIPFLGSSQQYNLPLNHSFSVNLEREMLKSDAIVHSGFKPILKTAIEESVENDSSIFQTITIARRSGKSFVARKLFYEHLISLDTGIVHLTIDPILNLEYGQELENDPRNINLYKSTRGFNVKLMLGEKVAVESSFRENQANLPQYLSNRIDQTQDAYGQGRVKRFGDFGYDFAMASAYISYSPSKRINIQAGHGKHFVGNGYRSLLLSDLSFNYPYFKINTNWFDNKIQYQNMYTLFQDLERVNSDALSEALFERKQGAFHHLEYSPNSKLSIGFFEGIVFPSLDTSGNIPVSASYWVPVIFLNTLIEDDESKAESVIGTNISLRLAKRVEVYNQFSIGNKEFDNPGIQIGAKWFFLDHFMLQGEVNSTPESTTQRMYSHYNQSLNHPVSGSNELIGIVQFQKNRWQSRLKLNTLSFKDTEVNYLDFRQAFIVNPSYNFTFHLGAQYRNQSVSEEGEPQTHGNPVYLSRDNQSFYFYFGLSTNLQNLYFDY